MMKGAAIFKLKDIWIIYSLSQTKSGFSIASEPYFKLPIDTNKSILLSAVREAINHSKKGVPDPRNWTESKKSYLKELGFKSLSELEKNGTLHCLIEIGVNNDLIFIPSKHAGPPGKGYLFKSKEHAIKVPAEASTDAVLDALNTAFNKCE